LRDKKETSVSGYVTRASCNVERWQALTAQSDSLAAVTGPEEELQKEIVRRKTTNDKQLTRRTTSNKKDLSMNRSIKRFKKYNRSPCEITPSFDRDGKRE
jgi:hypothetical protein